jgi:hypothetical protein
MKSSSAATATLMAFALLAAPGGVTAAESAAKAPPAEKAGPAAKDIALKAKPVLAKGMEADLILKNFGQPYEIKPMEAPDKDTKVERWIFRRKVKETTTQTASGQTMVPAYAGFGGGGEPTIREVPVVEYRLKRTTIYQVTELLMINGKLELAKQWMGQEEKYQ